MKEKQEAQAFREEAEMLRMKAEEVRRAADKKDEDFAAERKAVEKQRVELARERKTVQEEKDAAAKTTLEARTLQVKNFLRNFQSDRRSFGENSTIYNDVNDMYRRHLIS